MKSKCCRDTTLANYYGIWKHFNEFFIKLDTKPRTWEDRLILFVGHLINNNRKSSTIKSYISAIKTVLRLDGEHIDEDKYLLKSLTRACKLNNDKVNTRLPIQKGMLAIILNQTELRFQSQPYLAKLYCALFTAAYFGLLRIGEVAVGNHTILAKDVHIGSNKQKLMFVLHTSKTHGLNKEPQIVKITSTSDTKIIHRSNGQHFNVNNICPYSILRDYLNIRDGYRSFTEPFFVYRDSIPIKPDVLRKILKELLDQAGFNKYYYNFHSFRVGRSGDLARMGISIEIIRRLGRWRSSAVYEYLKKV